MPRSAVVFIHPADLPGPVVPGVLPFAADFLLNTTRAAYLLVGNGIRRKFTNIRFILSHAGAVGKHAVNPEMRSPDATDLPPRYSPSSRH